MEVHRGAIHPAAARRQDHCWDGNSMARRDAPVLFRKGRQGGKDNVAPTWARQNLPAAVPGMRRRDAECTAGAIVPERLRVLPARRAVAQWERRALPELWMAEQPPREQHRVLQPQEDAPQDAQKPEPHEREVRRQETDAPEQFPVPQEQPEQQPVWPRHLRAPPGQTAKSRQALRQQGRRQAWPERVPRGATARIWPWLRQLSPLRPPLPAPRGRGNACARARHGPGRSSSSASSSP